MIKEMYADLIEAAKEAYQNAYVPYSKFPVGAALKLTDGTIINGANIENASFGLTNCAERSALFTAFTKGYRREDIEAIAVVANTDRPISPCGACRQVMSELMPADATVILLSNKDEIKSYRVFELLPYSFTSEDL
ncbi:cytidine deaminase [Turicibacter faecis]|mgnify:CR=1 FL=1|jgi:cytidine deaminase|uniref:Cytidine deaminase n=1 Tax=Turicibacter faecis TaxID=2963365 RepID=A0ABN6Z9J6_9FIRM|nr:cytidine deaminase [Turicibacter sp. TS3]BEH90526.1 cytidine deaminase [Turicibacter sp. TC023]